jgi:hypothetical protein
VSRKNTNTHNYEKNIYNSYLPGQTVWAQKHQHRSSD